MRIKNPFATYLQISRDAVVSSLIHTHAYHMVISTVLEDLEIERINIFPHIKIIKQIIEDLHNRITR